MWRWQKRAWFPILKLEASRWQTSSVGLLYGQAVNGISWVQPAVAARSITAWESPKIGYYLQIISPLEKLICSSPSLFRFAVCHDPFIFLVHEYVAILACLRTVYAPPFFLNKSTVVIWKKMVTMFCRGAFACWPALDTSSRSTFAGLATSPQRRRARWAEWCQWATDTSSSNIYEHLWATL